MEKIKEMLIIELFQILVSGQLAKDLLLLGRFTTLKEELTLAENIAGCISAPASGADGVREQQGKTLEQIGVEPQFRLNYHLQGDNSGPGATQTMPTYKPYQGAVRLVNALNE